VRNWIGLFGENKIGIRNLPDRSLEVYVMGGNDPSTEVTIGDHPFQNTGLRDTEDSTPGISIDSLQGMQNRVFKIHNERLDLLINDHGIFLKQ
jgi:hypothetical protein